MNSLFEGVAAHRENNKESERILRDNLDRLSQNCRKLYEALMRGERLTGKTIIEKYGMIEYRRRIKDLRSHGVTISERILKGGVKEWWVDQPQFNK